eukprot:sb/3467855/
MTTAHTPRVKEASTLFRYLYVFYTTTIKEEKIVSTPGKVRTMWKLTGRTCFNLITRFVLRPAPRNTNVKGGLEHNNKVCYRLLALLHFITLSHTDCTSRPHVAAPGLRPGAKRRVLYETIITRIPGTDDTVSVEVMLKTELGNISATTALTEHTEAVASAVYLVAWILAAIGIFIFIFIIGCVIYKERSPYPKEKSPYPRDKSPYPRAKSPYPKEKSPYPKERSPYPREKVKRVNASENLVAMTAPSGGSSSYGGVGPPPAVAALATVDLDTSSITQCRVS